MDRRKLIATGLGAIAASMLPAVPVIATATEAAAHAQSDRYLIIPDIMRAHRDTVVEDIENNWRTHHYGVMLRWHIVDGKFDKLEIAPVNSDRYASWLKESPPKNGIPPHISFGGCIVPGKGDPTFKSRWEAKTRRERGFDI